MKMRLPAPERQETTVEEVYGGMTGTQTREFLRLCAERGYQSAINALSTCHVNPQVDKWYAEASEGERTHMANKLIKHGYPAVGVHSKAHIEGEAVANVYLEGHKDGIEEGRRVCIRELEGL